LGKADGAKRHLTERIDHHLEPEFGRKVEFWFRLEAEDGPHNLPFSFREPTSGRVNLHLHGEVGCRDTEQSKLRRALQKAGGKWESRGVRYQATLLRILTAATSATHSRTIRVWLTGCGALKASPPGATIF
jgi:hypothetical protein